MTQTDALALTLIIEGITALVIARAMKLSPASCALAAMLASLLTHPVLWAVFYDVHAVLGTLTTPALEIAVFLTEAPVYRWIVGCRWHEALLASLIVNAASWGTGEIIYALA